MLLEWLCFGFFILPVLWLAGVLLFPIVLGIVREFFRYSEREDDRRDE